MGKTIGLNALERKIEKSARKGNVELTKSLCAWHLPITRVAVKRAQNLRNYAARLYAEATSEKEREDAEFCLKNTSRILSNALCALENSANYVWNMVVEAGINRGEYKAGT